MTGRYQYHLPIDREEPLAGSCPPDLGLPPEIPTLASILRDGGYHTMIVGKWHSGDVPKFGSLKSGYEHFFGFGGEAVGYLTDLIGQHSVEAMKTFRKTDNPSLSVSILTHRHWPWEGPVNKEESRRIDGINLLHYDGGSKLIDESMIHASVGRKPNFCRVVCVFLQRSHGRRASRKGKSVGSL